MKNMFLKYLILTFFLFAGLSFAQTKVLRASLSTAPQTVQVGNVTVQQSVGHMGIIGSITHDSHTMTRGFLLPQMSASEEKPIADFNWVVYPNPFDTYINIDFDAIVSGDMVVRLHDILGQLIIEKEVQCDKQDTETSSV